MLYEIFSDRINFKHSYYSISIPKESAVFELYEGILTKKGKERFIKTGESSLLVINAKDRSVHFSNPILGPISFYGWYLLYFFDELIGFLQNTGGIFSRVYNLTFIKGDEEISGAISTLQEYDYPIPTELIDRVNKIKEVLANPQRDLGKILVKNYFRSITLLYGVGFIASIILFYKDEGIGLIVTFIYASIATPLFLIYSSKHRRIKDKKS